MRVSLFGLFLRCTSLMGPWPKHIQSILLISALLWISCFMMIMSYVHVYFTCVLTLLSSVLDSRAHPGSPPGFCILLAWGVSLTLLDSYVQVRELVACGIPRHWSEWRSGSVDLQPTVQNSILPGPLWVSRVFLLNSWVPFILFILVDFLVFPHLRISVI